MNKSLLSLGVAVFATAVPSSHATLALYDAEIASDNAGALPYIAVSTTSVSFNGTNSAPFDFGASSGAVTMEFILTGDPIAGGQDGFLGVGSNPTFSLRYEQWDDTGQLGFTHGGVADHLFTPAVLSPASPTHVTYRWDGATTMDLYLDGTLAGSAAAAGFVMPAGLGTLGNNAGNTEGMVGTIDRVTVYDSAIAPADITRHANAWLAVPEPSGMALVALAGLAMLVRRRR